MLTPQQAAALARAKDEGAAIGRIVHYHSLGSADGQYKSEPRAAIITALPPTPKHSGLSLAVLNPTGMFFNQDVPHSPTPKPGHWSWPPRI